MDIANLLRYTVESQELPFGYVGPLPLMAVYAFGLDITEEPMLPTTDRPLTFRKEGSNPLPLTLSHYDNTSEFPEDPIGAVWYTSLAEQMLCTQCHISLRNLRLTREDGSLGSGTHSRLTLK